VVAVVDVMESTESVRMIFGRGGEGKGRRGMCGLRSAQDVRGEVLGV
jgi:hypothetical protein